MSKAKDTGNSLRLYRRLLAYAWPYKWVFLVAVVGMIMLSASAAGFTALMKPLMDEGFVQRDVATIKMIPPLIVLLFLARGIGNFLAQYGTAWIGRRVTFDLRTDIFRRMMYLPSRYYESGASGGLISRIIYDVEQIAAGVTQVPYVVIGDGLTLLALAGWLLYLNWKLTLVFAVLLPVTALLMRAMNRRFLRTSVEIQKSMGEISQVVREASDGQRVVKAFGGQAAEIRAFNRGNEKNRRQTHAQGGGVRDRHGPVAARRRDRARPRDLYRAAVGRDHRGIVYLLSGCRPVDHGPQPPAGAHQRNHTDRAGRGAEHLCRAG